MALTGSGSAAKEQVAGMLQRILNIPEEDMKTHLDATDALAAAYCHYLQMGRPTSDSTAKSWSEYIRKNPNKLSKTKKV